MATTRKQTKKAGGSGRQAILKKKFTTAGVPARYKCHSIKVAVATKLVELGVPIDQVMSLGRWMS